MNTEESHKKGLTLFLTVTIGLAFIGFFVGTRAEYDARSLSQYESSSGEVVMGVSARSYKELMEDPFASNTQWLDSVDELRKSTPALLAEVPKATAEERSAALKKRASRRAYAGAPPVVPHKVTQSQDLACVSCHGDGVKIGDKIASKMSHEFMTNCTQCHVSSDGPMKMIEIAPSVSEVNAFAGLLEPQSGTPASLGAPPMIPHQTFMRESCMSCHGLTGQHGLRTTHPSRQSCTQCHAPSAAFDQRPLTPGLAPVGTP